MPTKTKIYEYVKFKQEAIKKAEDELLATLKEEGRKISSSGFLIKLNKLEEWDYDNEEEFFADYTKEFEHGRFYKSFKDGRIEFWVFLQSKHTDVKVTLPTRQDVEKVFNTLETFVGECRIPKPPPKKISKHRSKIKVFIGHGHSPQWRDLKDHLHEKHKLDVEAYEIGARAGLNIKEVLDDMLTSSSFALLVLTGEDLDAEGKLHARENVIHELGLFQGRLSWKKAIVLLEEGVSEFSNIHGLNQIRFSKGNIKETFGEVLATIGREFPK